MAQIIIRRFFITGVKVNEAGERAVKYQRRPLIGEPGLHFCPFRTAPLRECGIVIGVDVELDYRRALAEGYCFFSGPPTRDPGAVLGPLFPL